MSNFTQPPEALHLFELDQGPADQVSERVREVAPIIEEFETRWQQAVQAEKEYADFRERHPELGQGRRSNGPDDTGGPLGDNIKLMGRDVANMVIETSRRHIKNYDLTTLHEQATGHSAHFMTLAVERATSELVPVIQKGLVNPRNDPEVRSFVESYHNGTKLYSSAFVSQDVLLGHLLPLAKEPATARAFLDYIAAQAATEERVPGLLEILATNHIADTRERVVQQAIDTIYSDTTAHVPRIFGEWLDAADLNQSRLRREVVCSLQVMRLLAKDIEIDGGREALLRRFGAVRDAWPSELRAEYEKVVSSLHNKEQATIKALLKPHERRSRLPETRSFRSKSRSTKGRRK